MDCKQETPFRIGGVYRQRDGLLVELGTFKAYGNEPETAWARRVEGFPFGEGFRNLIDGRDTANWMHGQRTLIPGELTQTPSGWVALGAAVQEVDIKPHGSWQGDLVHRGGREYVRNGDGFVWYRDLQEGEEERLFSDSGAINCRVDLAERTHLQNLAAQKKPAPTFSGRLFLGVAIGGGQADPNAAMIARDGPARIALTKPRQLTVRIVSTAKPNPFQNFIAPDCSSVPDHLNASRHQMAGMKG